MNSRKLVKPVSYSILLIFLFLIPLFGTGPYFLHILIMTGVFIILSSSLRLIMTSGQLSFAHAGMMSIGAYTSALLVMRLGLSSWAALVIGGLAAGAFALLIGYPFVRIKGIYFALGTVFLSEIIRLIAEQWQSLTGGSFGLLNIPRPDSIVIPGLLNIDFASKVEFYYLILILVLVSLLILYVIERSRIGLTWSSIQQADFLSESVGVDTAKYKVLAFTIGSFFAGIAGAFYSQYITVITPSAFGFSFTVYIVVYMVVGGMSKFSGPIIGAITLTLISEWGRAVNEYQPYIFAVALLLIILFLPQGLVSLPERLRTLSKKRLNHA